MRPPLAGLFVVYRRGVSTVSESVAALIDTMAQHLQSINPRVDPLALLAAVVTTIQSLDQASASIDAVFSTAQDLAKILRADMTGRDIS